MANWLASALPVADAMSFEFDDINVTAQRVIMRTDVFMRGQVSEKWNINGS